MPSNKGKKKKKHTISMPKSNGKAGNISAGQRRYKFASDVMKDYEEYERQVAEEKKKSDKRSLWTTLGGVVGAGVGIMFAPAILGGAAAIAGVGALGSLATGVGTAAVVGGGSALGSKRGMEHSEKKHGRRKDVKTEKFYKSQAADATEAFKESYRDIDTSYKHQAIGSGVLAGLQAGGAFKKMGELGKKGLGIGPKDTGAVYSAEGVSALEDTYAVSKAGPGKYGAGYRDNLYEPALSNVDSQILEQTIAHLPSKTATASLGNLSDASLYSTLKKSLGNVAFQHGIAYGTSTLAKDDVPTEEIDFDPSKYYV